MSQKGFKLIAIRPLTGCTSELVKNLNANEYYYLYKNCRVLPDGEFVEKVVITSDLPPDVYTHKKQIINISAIVGRNGAGKSSLVELLYATLYNLAHKYKFIDKRDEDGKLYEYNPNVHAEIVYWLDGVFYKSLFEGSHIWLIQFNANLQGYQSKEKFASKKMLSHFFYSIVINYSLYGLNSEDMGHWLMSIFHKNDSYQTPIVLNPYRTKGNIDINMENYLVRSRLLANIIEGQAALFRFQNNERRVRKLKFSLDFSKFRKNTRGRIIFVETHDLRKRIFPVLWEVFAKDPDFQPGDEYLHQFATEYIIVKLKKITVKYKQYWLYRNFFTAKNTKLMKEYFEVLRDDPSHITYKIKQAINFLRFQMVEKRKDQFEELPGDITSRLLKIQRDFPEIQTIELLPPSFLSFKIEFESEADQFEKLSSGEKQKIYTLSTLIYHLRNLNSVKPKLYQPQKGARKVRLVKYPYINIIFDEIELYYHPDLQRRFIKDLLEVVRAANLDTIQAINFVFITHSPFILSDIPDDNILYLDVKDRQSIQVTGNIQTFGGNIHELLAGSFFLEKEGYMGEYAKDIIKSVITYLLKASNERRAGRKPKVNSLWNEKRARALIDRIGEPLIKRSLNELYAEAFLVEDDEIETEIRRLQKMQEDKKRRIG